MPKPMLKTPSKTESAAILSASAKTDRGQAVTREAKLKLDAALRRPRSKAYMEAVSKLDAGGHVHNQRLINDIIDAIKNEHPEIELFDLNIFIGIASVCKLGPPYEVHTLDHSGCIIEHYKSGRTLPIGMEKARGIALFGGYAFIEVYTDCCRAIACDGSVSVIPDKR